MFNQKRYEELKEFFKGVSFGEYETFEEFEEFLQLHNAKDNFLGGI